MTSPMSIGVLRTRFQPQTVRGALIRLDHRSVRNMTNRRRFLHIRLVKSLNQRSDEEFNL